MQREIHRVAVTGVGIISSLGNSYAEVTRRLRASGCRGRATLSGAARNSGCRPRSAGDIPDVSRKGGRQRRPQEEGTRADVDLGAVRRAGSPAMCDSTRRGWCGGGSGPQHYGLHRGKLVAARRQAGRRSRRAGVFGSGPTGWAHISYSAEWPTTPWAASRAAIRDRRAELLRRVRVRDLRTRHRPRRADMVRHGIVDLLSPAAPARDRRLSS